MISNPAPTPLRIYLDMEAALRIAGSSGDLGRSGPDMLAFLARHKAEIVDMAKAATPKVRPTKIDESQPGPVSVPDDEITWFLRNKMPKAVSESESQRTVYFIPYEDETLVCIPRGVSKNDILAMRVARRLVDQPCSILDEHWVHRGREIRSLADKRSNVEWYRSRAYADGTLAESLQKARPGVPGDIMRDVLAPLRAGLDKARAKLDLGLMGQRADIFSDEDYRYGGSALFWTQRSGSGGWLCSTDGAGAVMVATATAPPLTFSSGFPVLPELLIPMATLYAYNDAWGSSYGSNTKAWALCGRWVYAGNSRYNFPDIVSVLPSRADMVANVTAQDIKRLKPNPRWATQRGRGADEYYLRCSAPGEVEVWISPGSETAGEPRQYTFCTTLYGASLSGPEGAPLAGRYTGLLDISVVPKPLMVGFGTYLAPKMLWRVLSNLGPGVLALSIGGYKASDASRAALATQVYMTKDAVAVFAPLRGGDYDGAPPSDSRLRRNPAPQATTVQTILFDRDLWSASAAQDWLRDHGYMGRTPDTAAHYHRFRQVDPDRFQRGTLRTIPFGAATGIQAVVGRMK